MAEANKENEKNSTGEELQNDEELDSLLDSALDDFTELEKHKSAEKKVAKEDGQSGTQEEEDVERMWTEMMKQALDIDPAVRDMFQQGSSSSSTFAQDFSRVAEAAAKVINGENPPSNFADIMSETLKNLNDASQSIQSQIGNPEELANMFQELGLGAGAGVGSDGSMDDIPPFMQSLMQSFLSKDILYPAVKEFVEKYPAWLEENKTKLPADEWENYSKQLDVMKKLVEEFESEEATDSEDTKSQRFHKIMELMQEMQSLGQPPAELISTDVGSPSLDEATMANFLPPGMDPNQCSVM